MTRRLLWRGALLAVMFCVIAGMGMARQSQADPKDKEAIAKKGEMFVELFHKGDAEGLAAFWIADGEHSDESGRTLKGRKAIEAAFKEMFAAHKGLKLRVDSEALRFVTPDVAIEDGVAEVIPADGTAPTRARFTIVHVKQNGGWHISSLRNAMEAPPSNAQHLESFAWLIGNWAGERQKGELEKLSLAWTKNKNFIAGSFSTSARDVSLSKVEVRIGWDPVAKRVRSWSFDDSGAFGESSWTPEPKKLVAKSTLVLPDGKKAAATFIISAVDADTIALDVRDRTVGDERLPDVQEVKLKRVK
jgi:uncharacterized protein (TIGR02246 family)